MKESNTQAEAILQDLELQWNDHFHMRDQTWKTLTNTLLLFIGVVGLEIKEVGNLVMIPAYLVVVFTAFFGWSVAAHHRLRQGQKFAIITLYEKSLGLFDMKKNILRQGDERAGIASKVFTAGFIGVVQIGVGVVGIFLLVRRFIL